MCTSWFVAVSKVKRVITALFVWLAPLIAVISIAAISPGQEAPQEGGIWAPFQEYGILPDGGKYVKGEVIILFKEGCEAVIDSVRNILDGATTTGIDSFDSLYQI